MKIANILDLYFPYLIFVASYRVVSYVLCKFELVQRTRKYKN